MWSNWHRNKNDISTAALDLVRSATASILVSATYVYIIRHNECLKRDLNFSWRGPCQATSCDPFPHLRCVWCQRCKLTATHTRLTIYNRYVVVGAASFAHYSIFISERNRENKYGKRIGKKLNVAYYLVFRFSRTSQHVRKLWRW